MRQRMVRQGIATTCTSVQPRPIGAWTHADRGVAVAEYTKRIPLGRPQRPQEVAGLVSFMASNDAD